MSADLEKLQRKIIAKVYNRVSAVVMGLCDEGDRVYFGTSNDADILRDLRDEWDAHKIMGEDILSSEQEVAALTAENAALRAKAEKLAEALQIYSCEDGCNDCPEHERGRVGCGWTARAALTK